MKILALVALFFTSAAVAGEVLDIEFVDSGNHSYRTITIASDLKSMYGADYDYSNAKVLLIETPSFKNENYLAQDKSLNALGHGAAADDEILFVMACPSETYDSGYFTSMTTAKKLAGDKALFRVRLLNSSGLVLKESLLPLTTDQLRQWFKMH